MTNRRTASYIATLVYMNEPQLLLLRAGKSNVVALAIPSRQGTAMFIATTVTQKNWQLYMDEQVDLRYLFEYANIRTGYGFDLMKMKNKKIVMDPWVGPFTDDVLPGARFFARNHTEEDFEPEESIGDREQLLVDGEWDMPDFGAFYSRYSDVYYFVASTNDYEDENAPDLVKISIENAYRDKAFRGGFSYVHLYDALSYNRGRGRRLGVEEIQYASPGFMNINGEKEIFIETRKLITDYLRNRKTSKELYDRLYRYLSSARLLPMPGDEYVGNQPTEEFILQYTNELSEELGILNTSSLLKLVNGNALVYAKVVLSFHRRIDEASKFFAQGRVTFSSTEVTAATVASSAAIPDGPAFDGLG